MLKVGLQSAGWYDKNEPMKSFEYIKSCGFEAADFNIFTAPAEVLAEYRKLPTSLNEAMAVAASSQFIKEHLADSVIQAYCRRRV